MSTKKPIRRGDNVTVRTMDKGLHTGFVVDVFTESNRYIRSIVLRLSETTSMLIFGDSIANIEVIGG